MALKLKTKNSKLKISVQRSVRVDSPWPISYTHLMEMGVGLWVLLAIAVGILASRGFGRSGLGWFVLALVFSPLAGLLLFLLPARRRPCPFCAEPIQPSAVVCRFCGRDVVAAMDHPGLPKTTRVLLLILVVAVLVAALSQCEYRYLWWRGDSPIQVEGIQGMKSQWHIDYGLQKELMAYGRWQESRSAKLVMFVSL